MSRQSVNIHPLIQPEQVRIPAGQVLSHNPVPFCVVAHRRRRVDAEQEVDVRINRHRGELPAHRSRVRVATPEYRLYVFSQRQHAVIAQDGPQLRVLPSITISQQPRARLGQPGAEVGEQHPCRHQGRQQQAYPSRSLEGAGRFRQELMSTHGAAVEIKRYACRMYACFLSG